MAKKKAKEEMVEILRPVAGAVTISVTIDFGEDEWGVPDSMSHTMRCVIPDPQGVKSQSDRFLSAGFVFGCDLARVANALRVCIADANDIAAGFAREMQDWEKDYGRKSNG